MNTDIIKITYNKEQPVVNGRDLHEALQIRTAYKDWFPRMCEYGFIEGVDFSSFLSESTGGRPSMDHQMTIEMAKEICMIQRTDIGRKCRQYFLDLENAWNSPEAIMARALQFANRQIFSLQEYNQQLEGTVAVQKQQISEMAPKADYYNLVLNCKDLLSISVIAKDYGKSAQWMNQYLHEKGVQFNQSGIWLLYQKYAEKGYTSTKTHTYPGGDGTQHTKVHTYWTQAGRLFIYGLMKSDGFLPLIEQNAAQEEAGMNDVIKELNTIKSHIPQQTYRTILGQMRAGDIGGATVGIQRLKHKLEREEAANENIRRKQPNGQEVEEQRAFMG